MQEALLSSGTTKKGPITKPTLVPAAHGYPNGSSSMMVCCADGWFYVLGGADGVASGGINKFIRVNMSTYAVEVLATPTNQGLGHGSLNEFGGNLYLIGGIISSDYSVAVWKYTVATKTWSNVSTIPSTIASYSATTLYFKKLGDRLIATGGSIDGDYSKGIYMYKPGTNVWDTTLLLGYLNFITVSAVIGTKFYFGLGLKRVGSTGRAGTKEWNSFDPVTRVVTPVAQGLLPINGSVSGVSVLGDTLTCMGVSNSTTGVYTKVRHKYNATNNAWIEASTPTDPEMRNSNSSFDPDTGEIWSIGTFAAAAAGNPVLIYRSPVNA